jgi:transposase-like protein
MKLFELRELLSSPSATIAYLRRIRLLAPSVKCPKCGAHMSESKHACADGFRWRCNKRECRVTLSIRNGSFFAGSHLSLADQMLFVHLWCRGYSSSLIEADFNFSHVTIGDWSRFCRDICLWHIETDLDNSVIGGPGRVVEIDESLIVRRKYNRGRMLTQEWVFGGTERRTDGSWNCFIEFVEDRTEHTLVEIIKRRIAAGTCIVSDGWAAYRGLDQLPEYYYTHKVVNHSQNFVDPEDAEANTQRIENLWMLLKRFLRSRGTNKSDFNWEYVCEFLFRKLYCDTFVKFIEIVRRRYPLE